MTENEEKHVGRPFNPEAARKAQAKAVESRLRNKEAKEAKEANPNGELIASIENHVNCLESKVDRCIALLVDIVDLQRKLHPKSEDIFGKRIGG